MLLILLILVVSSIFIVEAMESKLFYLSEEYARWMMRNKYDECVDSMKKTIKQLTNKKENK